jgi:hypothetical protein
MNEQGWPKFSFSELLKPPEGWRTDHAILCTYSADLVVIVTSLLALSGCDLESRRTGSRVELVRAIEALRGRVRILAQAGRVAIPAAPVAILKVLDKFLSTVHSDETTSSFHPKVALLRFHKADDPKDRQWRIWLGSRNLTRGLNWEAGLMFVSRQDGKGQVVEGLCAVAEELAARAKLHEFTSRRVRAELSKLTWECPAGCEVRRVSLLGPGLEQGFPEPASDTERMFMVSPFLDTETVRRAGRWGGPKTQRTLVSIDPEFQRLLREDDQVFNGFENLCREPLPDLPTECAVNIQEENSAGVEITEAEEAPPQGLHAKLLFAAKGKRRQLWIGSPNATERGWGGHNFEIVAEVAVNQEVADGIEAFVQTCERYTPVVTEAKEEDEVEQALEKARKALSGRWHLRQIIIDGRLEIVASTPPPIVDARITVEVAAMGGAWKPWPPVGDRIAAAGTVREWERTDFVQIRVRLDDMVCAWLQIAPCDPPPDERRDHGVIAQYLDPQTFLWWLRSLLGDSHVEEVGGDWDTNGDQSQDARRKGSQVLDLGSMPTVEEILRAWARDSAAFRTADQKVKTYLSELERRANEFEAPSNAAELLRIFRQTWETLAEELQ